MSDRTTSPDATTVITPNARLARELRWQFDQQQLALGKTAWESADILPWKFWLERIWKSAAEHSEQPRTLLNDLQVAAVWEDIIAADIRRVQESAPLWNLHATAQSALAAWRVINEWQIELARCAKSPQEDHQCFVRWARAYQKRCGEKNWTDSSQLAAQLCQLAANKKLPREVCETQHQLTGFDRLQPQQQSVISALQNTGVPITVTEPPATRNQTTELQTFPDEASQWLAAAHWARAKLQAEPKSRLAIIAPDLANSAAAIEYALHQLLAPQQLAAPAVSAALPWHRSLGETLSRHAVANAALVALSPLGGGMLSTESLCQLIRSPFIHGADAEADARAKLEVWCRERLPFQMRWRQFVKDIAEYGHGGYPQLLNAFNAANKFQDENEHSKSQSAAYWVNYFESWLKKLGWHGEQALNSDEFQIARAFQRELRNLALLDLTSKPMTAAAALSWLRRQLDRQPFQVEAHDAPVQVLGVLEATGQQFDGVWFGNLIEADWPRAVHPNPFIALALQRAAGVTEASVQSNWEIAEAQQKRIIAGGAEVILSAPLTVDEVAVEVSPLLAEFTAAESALPDFNTPAKIIHSNQPKLETFTDPSGPAFAVNTTASGGARLIENQSQCPFRAFAIHRLGADSRGQNEQGLSPMDRGSLIHRTLEIVWNDITSSKRLNALTDDELKKIITRAAEHSAKRYQVKSGCGEKFQQTQINWVCDTVAEWLAIEKLRDEFVVSETEQNAEVNLNGLKLNLKIDRIDKFDNESHALIDYKTGAPDSVKDWANARPQAPQLPLYAINLNQAVGEVTYAIVKRGACKFYGVKDVAELDFADWDELLNHWRDALGNLAQEFLDGDARVSPQKGACEFCDLHTFCRIDGDQ